MFGWQSLAVRGPMGRTVDDVAMVLSVISGPDPRNPIALDATVPADVNPADLRGKRVAWSPDLGGAVDVDPAVLDVLGAQLSTLAGLGCNVEEACIDFDGADEAFRTLRAWTFAYSMDEEIRTHRDELKPSLLWNIEQGQFLSGRDVAAAIEAQTVLYQRAQRFFERYDLLVLPTVQVPPFPVTEEYPAEVAGRPQATYLDWMRSAYDVTMTGCPALSLPAGFTAGGLPVGIQFVGPHRAEAWLLAAGMAFEEATGFGATRPDVLGQPRSSWADGHHVAVGGTPSVA
jgi:amidase